MNWYIYSTYLVALSFSAYADMSCVEGPATKEINGKAIYRECWKYEEIREDYNTEYKDSCQLLKKAADCHQVETRCVGKYTSDNRCTEYIDTYQCGNLLDFSDKEIIHIQSVYKVTRDEKNIKECELYDLNKDCILSEEVCMEGAETRNINGKEISKDCWVWKRKYACFAGTNAEESDCKGYEDKCKLISQECMERNKIGECVHVVKELECNNVVGHTPVSMDCKGASYCIGESCEFVEFQKNKNMKSAISALGVLAQMQREFQPTEQLLFQGVPHSCKKFIYQGKNCCNNKGVLLKIGLSECGEEARILSAKRGKGLCHYVGEYCSKKIKLVFGKSCVQRTQRYCCFSTRMSRVLQEQARTQLRLGWGSGRHPDCRALSIEQIQRVNWNAVDLSEVYPELLEHFKRTKDYGISGSIKGRVEKGAEKYRSITKDALEKMEVAK